MSAEQACAELESTAKCLESVVCHGAMAITKQGPKVHVFSFPQADEARQAWIRAIPRENLVVSANSRVINFECFMILLACCFYRCVASLVVCSTLRLNASRKALDVLLLLQWSRTDARICFFCLRVRASL